MDGGDGGGGSGGVCGVGDGSQYKSERNGITKSFSRYTPRLHTKAYSEACCNPLYWTTDTRTHVAQGQTS